MSEQVKEDVRKLIIDLFMVNNSFADLKASYELQKKELTDKITTFLKKKDKKEITFDYSSSKLVGKKFKCNRVTSVSVDFNADKVEEKLGKERSMNYVQKEYTVNDIEGLTRLFISSGNIKAADFKKFIDVKKTVDVKKLDQDEKLGDISFEELRGCYSTREKGSYLKINEVRE